jgi:hypothetical protein
MANGGHPEPKPRPKPEGRKPAGQGTKSQGKAGPKR